MKLIRKYEDIILSILSILMTVSFYGYIVYDKSFPLPEGWYTYYAQCIHNGSLPYRDFEFLFAPLYIYLISFFTSIFGYDLIYLRIFGIIIFSIIGIEYSAVGVPPVRQGVPFVRRGVPLAIFR